jgi:hypothetical protein
LAETAVGTTVASISAARCWNWRRQISPRSIARSGSFQPTCAILVVLAGVFVNDQHSRGRQNCSDRAKDPQFAGRAEMMERKADPSCVNQRALLCEERLDVAL